MLCTNSWQWKQKIEQVLCSECRVMDGINADIDVTRTVSSHCNDKHDACQQKQPVNGL